MIFARIGAVLYGLWALLHVYAAYGVYRLAQGTEGMVQHRLEQQAAYLLVIALAVLAVAAIWTWRNRRVGYWINLALVSVADVIFLAVVVLPSDMPLTRGLIGPALWILAVIATTLGVIFPGRGHRRSPV